MGIVAVLALAGGVASAYVYMFPFIAASSGQIAAPLARAASLAQLSFYDKAVMQAKVTAVDPAARTLTAEVPSPYQSSESLSFVLSFDEQTWLGEDGHAATPLGDAGLQRLQAHTGPVLLYAVPAPAGGLLVVNIRLK